MSRLDGKQLFAVALWRLPDGFGLGTPEANRASDEAFLQSAGSAAAMTVELKWTIEGVAQQFALGRHTAAGEQDVAIAFRARSLTVPANEVFTADEAADICAAYYETNTVPAGFALRELAI